MRFFTIAVLAALGNSGCAADGPNPNRYMVKGIVDELDEERVGSDASQAFGAKVVMSLLDKSHSPSMLVMEFNNEADAESFKGKYDTDDSIYTVEVDEPRYMTSNVRGSGIENEVSGRALAQDIPWGIENVFNDETDLGRGIPGEINGPTLPTTITHPICIIDSGYQLDHPDLTNSASAADPDQNSTDDPYYFGTDACEHGTHVAGTILASDNGDGVIGVFPGAPGTKIVKVFSGTECGWIYSSTLIHALAYCRESGAKIVTMSLGGGGASSQELEAFTDATDDDMLIIAAAGNGGNAGKLYPASYPAIMSVGAIDVNNNIAGFSQYNDEVDISGPGVDVRSTTRSFGYGLKSGTSMATPHVSGVALLLWNTFPNCTAHEIRNALETSALDLGDAGRDDRYGYGTVKFWAANDYLTDVLPCGSTKSPTFSPSPSSAPTACVGTDFRLDLVTDRDGSETEWTVKGNAGGTVHTGRSYSGKTVYSIKECIPDDACEFTITDSWGDGICCEYGNGTYTVFMNDVEVGSGGEFGLSESVDLCGATQPPTTLSPTTSSPTTPAPTTSSPSTLAPTTSAPTTPSPTTLAPITSSNHMIVCGRTGRCGNLESRFASDTEEHEVRCCSTNEIAGWTKKSGCTVWGGSTVGDDFQCYHEQNFESAFDLCEAAGARLCTKDELEDSCAQGTGCGHDIDLIWSSTDDSPTTAPTSSPSSSSNHMIVCGRTGGCGNLESRFESDDGEHEVRCCSTSEFTGSSKRNGCNVWGGSTSGIDSSCHAEQNFASATDLCVAAGARLCTKGELEDGCTVGTGCGYDRDLIWTSTTPS